MVKIKGQKRILAIIISIILTMSFTLENVQVKAEDAVDEEVLISDNIGIKGFQIRNNQPETTEEIAKEQELFGVSFRIIGNAPKIGESIVVSGETYTVKKVGIIYVLDTNTKGSDGADVYGDEKYTLMDLESTIKDNVGNIIGYKGKNVNTSFGYLSTEIGIMKSESSDSIIYCQTLTKMELSVANTIHTRAFVLADDAEGNEEIIYGKNINSASVAEIANYLYINNMCSNAYAHQFLFNRILNGKNGDSSATSVLQQAGNPFYRDTEIPYGWNGSIFKPDKSE